MTVEAVVFDCDGVLIDNISSWWAIHEHFGTRNEEMLEKFLNKEITEEEFFFFQAEDGIRDSP